MRNLFKKPEAKRFSGECLVREFTADGHFVGRCYFATYDGECPRHGGVHLYLAGPDLVGWPVQWPRDYDLTKYDGQEWAERLRKDNPHVSA